MTASRTDKVAEFVVLGAEAVGRLVALVAVHTSDPALDAAMVLLKTGAEVGRPQSSPGSHGRQPQRRLRGTRATRVSAPPMQPRHMAWHWRS